MNLRHHRRAVSRPGSKGSASRSFESLAEMAPGAQEDTYGVSINGGTTINGVLDQNEPGGLFTSASNIGRSMPSSVRRR